MKLNSRNSWCHTIFFTSLALICIILGLEYNYAVLPLHGTLLIVYLLTTTILTAWITLVCLQKILESNKPFMYDDKSILLKLALQCYNHIQTYFKHRTSKLQEPSAKKPLLLSERVDVDTRIKDFVKDIEDRFILKWYTYISNDQTFPSEVNALLDDVIHHFLQVVVDVDAKKLVHAFVVIFLKHVKEFRRTLKRSCKNNCTVEDVYRYSHIGTKSDKTFEHFIHQLTVNVIRQFINWELWNSLPCRTLVSILSRKLTTYLITYMSSPGFLNYQIVKICASESTKLKLKLDNYAFISISDVDYSGSLQQIVESPLYTIRDNYIEKLKLDDNTPKTSPKKRPKKEVSVTRLSDFVDSTKQRSKSEKSDEQPLKAKIKTDTRPRASEAVKIYESKSATKTWRNSTDLECIPLGQDLLAFQEFADPNSQIDELIEKKLWKDNTADDEKSTSVWDIPESWYGEEDAPDAHEGAAVSPTSQFQNYLKSNATTAAIITNTMKPLGNVTANTLHNMKELQQSTVNTVSNVVKPVSQATTNAMHKIGDLQDEAAGVVEGILDFGMAGLRKGLRLTGLQENFNELTQKAKNEFQIHKPESHKIIDLQKPKRPGKITEAIKIIEKDSHKQKSAGKLVKTPHVLSEDKVEQQHSSTDSDEAVWVNPLSNSGSPSFEGDILLEKTPDSLPKLSLLETAIIHDIPLITEDVIEGSPDVEYEETQDFASTIAKLRYLLQQRSSESSFTTPSLSPMPQEEASKTPADPPPNDLTKADGAMPSLYKFCARTATGVFQNTLNTIKTALPGNINESNQSLAHYINEDWTFVETDVLVDDFYSRMKRLLSERRAYCTVDTAYEAIDSLEISDKADFTWAPRTGQFDDDMDEFDLQIPITKALVDVVCELISDSNTYMLRDSVVKAVLLLIGNFTETFIDKKSESVLHLPNKYIGKLPESTDQNVLALKIDEMVQICKEIFPGAAKILLGENTIQTGVRLFINSLQSQKINQDVFMQMLEIFASHVVMACSKTSPAYSA